MMKMYYFMRNIEVMKGHRNALQIMVWLPQDGEMASQSMVAEILLVQHVEPEPLSDTWC